MNHKLTHILYLIRKHVLRRESRPGNFRRLIVAFVLCQLIIVSRVFIPEYLDESLLLKSLFSVRGTITPPDNIVVIKIDDISYKKLNLSPRKPFPRAVSARAIKSVQKDQPKLLILDLFFPREEDEPEGTSLFVDALGLGPVTIASPPIVADSETEDLYLSDPAISESADYELPMTVSSLSGLTLYINRDLANFNNLKEYESVPLLKPLRSHVDPNLKAPEQHALINYYGPEGTIRSFSLWELFEDDRIIPNGFFKDKVVLAGFKSELRERGHSDKEILGVPVKSKKSSYEMYGVEIHANIAGNLLEGNWISRLSTTSEAIILFFLLFALIKGVITFHPFSALWFMIAYLLLWFMGTYIAFSYFNLFIPGVFLAFLYIPIIFAGAACASATLALKELKSLKRTFGV